MLHKKELSIGRNINLHVISTDKFKTNLFGIYLQRPLDKNEVTKNALLSMILNKATEKYPSFIDINKKLDDLYGTVLVTDVTKKGERQIISIKMQMPNDKYLKGESIFYEGIRLLNDVLNHPLIEEEGFSDQYFNQERDNLRDRIKGRINDKMKYALDRCIEEMCSDENYMIYEYGFIDDLNDFDRYDLYKHYKKILKESPMDIFFVGDIEEEILYNLILNNIEFNFDEKIRIHREKVKKNIDGVKYVEDNFNVNQGKLTLGFRTNIPYEDELYNASVLFSTILGGGPNSKLFLNLREKESLCYYIFSRVDKFKSIMLVSSGIEFENYEKSKDLIIKEFKSLQEGNFDEEDIVIAKKALINSIKSIADSPNGIMDYFHSQVISNTKDSLDETIKKIEKVNRESIIEAGRQFELDTVYFLNKIKED